MQPILEMQNITKTFPGVNALENVNLTVMPGEIHGVVGENGAGKSTLMMVLSGVYPHGSYSGDIVFEGKPRAFHTITDSEDVGIIIIHQELALVPLLSIAENIFLGHETGRFGVIDWFEAYARSKELLAKVGLHENPNTLIESLGTGKQQLVEIAKALGKKVKLLILDEPTSSLNERDSDALLTLLSEFRGHGIASILITHKLGEVLKVADHITVLRDGSTVGTFDCRASKVNEDLLIKAMVGRELTDRYPARNATIGEPIFEVKNWNVFHPQHQDRKAIKEVSLNVRAGEVVGIAGLMGSGRTELAMSLFGRSWGQRITGEVFIHGKKADVSSIPNAMAAGFAYATEDRKTYGLILIDHIKHNITLANLGAVSKRMVINDIEEIAAANKYRKEIGIRSSNIYQVTNNLSGGNQQKVVLSKWLFAGPDVLILDEPTRGIDVGAKYEIHSIINTLAEAGKAIIVISSEMPELLGITDRVYVMNEGSIVAEMPAQEASQEKIMRAIMNSWEH
ncbi:MAG: sugar ABC transporter ATP-binding protein [Alphaproteobacteria bacterium]|nr:sugar ABC transporter ATP-binding protein [Alphaproteobacteria bacterium]